MTWFPLRADIRSSRDDPLSRADFIRQFPQFLKDKPHGGGPDEKPFSTMKELLKESPALGKKTCIGVKTTLLFNRWTFQTDEKKRWRLDHIDALEEASLSDHHHSNDQRHDRVLFCDPSILPFWKKFRAAVLAEDARAVADMTWFPIRIFAGEDKSGGPLSRAEFIERFPQFLKATAGSRAEFIRRFPQFPKATDGPKTMKELIKEIPTLEKESCDGFTELLFFDHWSFQKYMGDRWGFNSVDIRPHPR